MNYGLLSIIRQISFVAPLESSKQWIGLSVWLYRNKIPWNEYICCLVDFSTIWTVYDLLVFSAEFILTYSYQHVYTRESVSSVLISIYCARQRTKAEELLTEI